VRTHVPSVHPDSLLPKVALNKSFLATKCLWSVVLLGSNSSKSRGWEAPTLVFLVFLKFFQKPP
jgi:hypothetical protein